METTVFKPEQDFIVNTPNPNSPYFSTFEEWAEASEGSSSILCIIGQSGSGKSTLEKALSDKYGWHKMRSSTTRPPRFEGEDTHIFYETTDLAMRQYEKDKESNSIIAETKYGENIYWMNINEIKSDNVNLFVVDLPGFQRLREELYEKRKTLHEIYSVFLFCDREIRLQRCEGNVERTDRNESDYSHFTADFFVDGKQSPESVLEQVKKWMEEETFIPLSQFPKTSEQEEDDSPEGIAESLEKVANLLSNLLEEENPNITLL